MLFLIKQYLKCIRSNGFSTKQILARGYVYVLMFYVAYWIGKEVLLTDLNKYATIIVIVELLIRIVFYSRINFNLKPLFLLSKKSTLAKFEIFSLALNILNGVIILFAVGLSSKVHALENKLYLILVASIIAVFHSLISFRIRELKIRNFKEYVIYIAYALLLLVCYTHSKIVIENATISIFFLFILSASLGFYTFQDLRKDILNYFSVAREAGLVYSSKTYFQYEMAFLIRNKRVREHVSFNLIFAFVIFLRQLCLIEVEIAPIQTLFFGILSTGIIIISIGQFFLAWDSAYFPFLIINNNWQQYIKSKLLFLTKTTLFISIIEFFLLWWFNKSAVLFLITGSLINIGFVQIFLFATSYMNDRKINLNNTIFFNFSGSKPIQFMVLGLIGIFLLLFKLLLSFFESNVALFILNFLAFIPIVVKYKLENLIAKKIKKNQYKLLNYYDNYRNK